MFQKGNNFLAKQYFEESIRNITANIKGTSFEMENLESSMA